MPSRAQLFAKRAEEEGFEDAIGEIVIRAWSRGFWQGALTPNADKMPEFEAAETVIESVINYLREEIDEL